MLQSIGHVLNRLPVYRLTLESNNAANTAHFAIPLGTAQSRHAAIRRTRQESGRGIPECVAVAFWRNRDSRAWRRTTLLCYSCKDILSGVYLYGLNSRCAMQPPRSALE